VGAGLALTNALVVAVFLPESLTAEDKARLADRPRRRVFDPRGLAEAFSHKRVGPLLGIRTATSISFAIFETGFSLWALTALGLSSQQNGMVLGYVGVLSVIVQLFVIKRLTSRFSDDGILLVSLSIAALALGLWGFVPNVWLLLVLMPALSVGLAVTNTVLTSALTKAVHRDEVGGILGLQTSITSFTRIPAPIIGGTLIGLGTVWGPGLLAGLIVAAMVPYAYLTLCWRPGAPACVNEEILEEMNAAAPE